MVGVPRVGEVAGRRLPVVGADQTLAKAAEVMLANRSLGVVTLDVKRRPALVLSYRRLVAVVARGAGVDSTIAEHAVDEPVVVQEWAPVTEALDVMKREGVRFLPVVDARGRLVAVFEPGHAARALWDLLDYGTASIEARLRRLIVMPADATIRAAARAMDDNGAPEVLVKTPDGLRLLREWDFLRAVAEGRVDEGRLGDYARGQVVRVPSGFDAKAALDLMEANDVDRLIVEGPEGQSLTVTMSDLAFEAAVHVSTPRAREVAFVLIKTKPGAEADLAAQLVMEPGVTEVHLVSGTFDVLAKLEGPSIREIYRVILEKIRTRDDVLETQTLAGVKVAEAK